MTRLWRLVLAAALPLMAAFGGLLATGTAQAQSVASGSWTFSGDSTDYITQGESESFSTANGDPLVVSTTTGNPGHEVGVRVFISANEWWDLEIAAGGTAVLAPGTYAAATRYPFNTTGPGLNLDGNGRGCNTLTGSFTVTDAVFGPQGYVQQFDATFVQHCEGATAAATGAIHISNPPAPAPAPATQPGATGTQGGTGGATGTTAGGGATSGNATSSGGAAGSRSATGSTATAYGSGVGAAITATRNVAASTPVTLKSPVSLPVLLVAFISAWLLFAAAGIATALGVASHLRSRANGPTAQSGYQPGVLATTHIEKYWEPPPYA